MYSYLFAACRYGEAEIRNDLLVLKQQTWLRCCTHFVLIMPWVDHKQLFRVVNYAFQTRL